MGLALPAESASLWNTIHREAVAVAAAEPALAAWMHEAVVNQRNLAKRAGTIDRCGGQWQPRREDRNPANRRTGLSRRSLFDRDRDPRSEGTT
jgi:hypothetical protein